MADLSPQRARNLAAVHEASAMSLGKWAGIRKDTAAILRAYASLRERLEELPRSECFGRDYNMEPHEHGDWVLYDHVHDAIAAAEEDARG